MMRNCRILVATLGIVLACAAPALALDPVPADCTVEAYGELSESGDRFSAEARPADDDPATITGKGRVFHHLADGREFSGKVELSRCRRNGGITADLVGHGHFRGSKQEVCDGDAGGRCREHEFRVAARDDPTIKLYTFRILDDNGEDFYAVAETVTVGTVVVTPLP